MARSLPLTPDQISGRFRTAGSQVPVEWVSALLTRWRPLGPAGNAAGRRPATPAAEAVQILETLALAGNGARTTAAQRSVVYDVAAILVPMARRGTAALRYATAAADKAEWVRSLAKKATGRRWLQLLRALERSGALLDTPTAVRAALARHEEQWGERADAAEALASFVADCEAFVGGELEAEQTLRRWASEARPAH